MVLPVCTTGLYRSIQSAVRRICFLTPRRHADHLWAILGGADSRSGKLTFCITASWGLLIRLLSEMKCCPSVPLQGKENNYGQSLGSADSGSGELLGENSPPQGQQNPRVTPHPAYDPNVRMTPGR